MSNIAIRKAQESDIEGLVDLWWKMQASHHEYDHLFYVDKGEDYCRKSYRKHLETLLHLKLSHL